MVHSTVTLCSAFSLVSCRRPADQRGDRSLAEEAEDLATKTLCGQSPSESAVIIVEVKCQQVAALLLAPLHIAEICKSVGESERLVLKAKSL
jgi:hypothetical protein